jgi:hypothetical protein
MDALQDEAAMCRLHGCIQSGKGLQPLLKCSASLKPCCIANWQWFGKTLTNYSHHVQHLFDQDHCRPLLPKHRVERTWLIYITNVCTRTVVWTSCGHSLLQFIDRL